MNTSRTLSRHSFSLLFSGMQIHFRGATCPRSHRGPSIITTSKILVKHDIFHVQAIDQNDSSWWRCCYCPKDSSLAWAVCLCLCLLINVISNFDQNAFERLLVDAAGPKLDAQALDILAQNELAAHIPVRMTLIIIANCWTPLGEVEPAAGSVRV